MADRQTCVVCKKTSPATETDYTLISSKYGWRLRREQRPDGTTALEWRCPTCWKAFKETQGAQGELSSGERSQP